MTVLLLQLVVNWQVFTINNLLHLQAIVNIKCLNIILVT